MLLDVRTLLDDATAKIVRRGPRRGAACTRGQSVTTVIIPCDDEACNQKEVSSFDDALT